MVHKAGGIPRHQDAEYRFFVDVLVLSGTLKPMPTVKFQFDTFLSSGSGVAWSNPGNAVSEGGGSATVALTSGQESQLLVCTGADLSSEFPAGTVIQSVKVRIKARIDPATEGEATIHKIWAWDGSATQGRNMAGYPSSVEGSDHQVAENDPISLDTTLTYSDRGVADWLWWPDQSAGG